MYVLSEGEKDREEGGEFSERDVGEEVLDKSEEDEEDSLTKEEDSLIGECFCTFLSSLFGTICGASSGLPWFPLFDSKY